MRTRWYWIAKGEKINEFQVRNEIEDQEEKIREQKDNQLKRRKRYSPNKVRYTQYNDLLFSSASRSFLTSIRIDFLFYSHFCSLSWMQ